MPESNHFHLHIHEGVTPEVVRAAIDAYHGRSRANNSGDPADESSSAAIALAQRAYRESDGMMADLLAFLAEDPGRLVPFTEASAKLGYESARSMPGLLGAFGRRSKHRYGGTWPFEKVLHDGAWHMRMDPEIAEAIRALGAE
jgi:hypothetical protein